MSEVGEAIDEMREAFAEVAEDVLPDVCTVKSAGSVTNSGWGGTSQTPGDVYEELPCKYEPLSAYERTAGGSVVGGADHRIEMPAVWDGEAVEIRPDYTVHVAARGVNPERVFQVTGQLSSSMDVSLVVAAKLNT